MAVKTTCSIMLFALLLAHSSSYAGIERFWMLNRNSDTPNLDECDNLTEEQQQQLIAAYQAARDEQKKRDLKRRMEWFCHLSDDEQQRMRLAWQNMSSQERLALKKKLDATTDLEKREQIRRDVLTKYTPTSPVS